MRLLQATLEFLALKSLSLVHISIWCRTQSRERTLQPGAIHLLDLSDLNEALEELYSKLLQKHLASEACEDFVPSRSPKEVLEAICAVYGLRCELVRRKFLQKFKVDVDLCAVEASSRACMAAYEVAASLPSDHYEKLANLRRLREQEARLNASVEILGDAVEALHGYLTSSWDPDLALEAVSAEFGLKRGVLSREFTKKHYPPEARRRTFA